MEPQLLMRFGSAAKRFIDAMQKGDMEAAKKEKRDILFALSELTPEDANDVAEDVRSKRNAIDRLTRYANCSLLAVAREDVRSVLELCAITVSVSNELMERLVASTAAMERVVVGADVEWIDVSGLNQLKAAITRNKKGL